VKLHGVLGDAEGGGDVAVGAAGGELLHHLELAMCEGLLDLAGRAGSLVEDA
jgi:hypothetical protein